MLSSLCTLLGFQSIMCRKIVILILGKSILDSAYEQVHEWPMYNRSRNFLSFKYLFGQKCCNIRLFRRLSVANCPNHSYISQFPHRWLGGYVYMQHNIGIGRKTNRSGVRIPSCSSFLPALLTTFSAVELTYVSNSENKDCCGYFILCAMFLEIFYNLVQ